MQTFNALIPITAVIITHNVARTIRECLLALEKVCDEVIVLDSFSEDGTAEICRELGVTVVSQPWLGYSATKNLGNSMAKNDWILSVDADEVLSEELAETLRILEPVSGKVYSLDRFTNYCGYWIQYCGWYPDWKIRLFEKRHVQWQGDYVHETLYVPVGFEEVRLKGKLYHYSYFDKEDHYRRIARYAMLSAKEQFSKGKKPGYIKSILSPFARFFRTYFINLGMLDGRAGWLISIRSAKMVRLRYQNLRNMWAEKQNTER